ncbi:hydroxymethylglutaryl-CoA lyase [Roseovarius pacificus]|uniref:Hydroxymethylglutaryl-CoA lyase n=1 Tax=Roseovarius pacificus TaxID=337701 RepID=A0A1M7KBY8_9RHOB|nr:hydroxymethylglutaryl-CoA lyase [Roseovarius pacificus]GGO62655.1 hydroxymethylglutaryl-CoA lyase [Roseovarius pacificus]SHM62770.1 hydroxymethylglutaryl-CoA lyase [Roseovarius pacificus]
MTELTITEVGMRDGLQMESVFVPTNQKIQIGLGLIDAGLQRIEATSFVSPKAVPQLADATEVISELRGRGATLAALVPNPRGAERALEAGVDELVMFISASETHNRHNVNRSVAESLENIAPMAQAVADSKRSLRAAVSTAFGCPWQGNVSAEEVARVIEGFAAQGVGAVTLGDTTGMATPPIVRHLCAKLAEWFPEVELTLHFHNTRGIGLVNVIAGLEAGITRYESALGGLGGCPFAKGASGNICTEDLVYLAAEMGLETGLDLRRLINLAERMQEILGHELSGQVMKAGPRLPVA